MHRLEASGSTDPCDGRLGVESAASLGGDKGMVFEGSTNLGWGGGWSLSITGRWINLGRSSSREELCSFYEKETDLDARIGGAWLEKAGKG